MEPLNQLLHVIGGVRVPQDLIDIGIVAFVIYRVLLLVKGTRALYMLYGVVVIAVVAYLSALPWRRWGSDPCATAAAPVAGRW